MTPRDLQRTEAIERVAPLFTTHRSFVLTTHVNPDGDGLGSEIALAAWLRAAGKDARIINHSPTPAIYRFLDSDRQVTVFDHERDSGVIAAAEVIIVLDTNHPGRLGSMEQAVRASRALKVCIDHHLNPDPFADHAIIDEEATSTGEIVYRLLLHLQPPPLPPLVASALYCAIMTDTGSFRYPRVNGETHRIVADLITWGADPVAIYGEVFERWSHGRIHLLGETLMSLKTEYGGLLAHVTITKEMLRRTSTMEEDTENFTTYPMSVEGVTVGLLFLEIDNGVKVSFRSKGEIAINRLAQMFGGNGHTNAAGARIEGGKIDDLRRKIIAAAQEFVTTRRT